jgi:hypothetical protein
LGQTQGQGFQDLQERRRNRMQSTNRRAADAHVDTCPFRQSGHDRLNRLIGAFLGADVRGAQAV